MRHSFLRTTAWAVLFVCGIASPAAWGGSFNWTKRTSAGSRDWNDIASSSDGAKLAACAYSDYIYTSTDYGATWTTRTSAGNRGWGSIASSSDGVKLAACDYNGYIYTSTDSGASWTERTSSGTGPWAAIASSSDGTKLAACAPTRYIYTSTDSGESWTQQTASGQRTWFSITSSSDGTKLAAGDHGGYIYTSTDSGASWTARTNAGSRDWEAIASSSDGTKLLAAADSDYLYTSTDSGASWSSRAAAGSRSWDSVASSSDGTVLAAVPSAGHVYVSVDSGANWTENVPSPSGEWWKCVTMSSDGTRLAVAAWDNYVYTGAPATAPTVTTTAISDITGITASSGGNVTADGGESVTARGVCWSTSENPDIDDSKTTDGTGTGEFTSSITGLSFGTTYHVRAYATNSVGTAYGSDVSFTTKSPPTVTTTLISNIAGTTAESGGDVTTDGGASVTARGVCWRTSANPTTGDSKTTDGTGTGSFASNITGLSSSATYHVRAYATNSVGTAYGSDVAFTTDIHPTVTTTAVSNVTGTTADSGGNVTADGGESVTARGVCWSTLENPTTSDSKTTNGTGTGSFISNLTGLSAGTTYHVRAYATNSVGTSYGSDVEFTTTATTPTVTTALISNLIGTTAESGGDVTADGGASVTARGVCWSTSENPTTSDSKTTNGTGTGSFASNITELSAGTTYYVRAYATNSVGTAYGNQVVFSTQSGGGGSGPTPTPDPEPTNSTTVADDGTAEVQDGDAHVDVDGFAPGTAIQLETTEDGDLVVTAGDESEPELTVTISGAGEAPGVNLSADEAGNPSIQVTDAGETDVTLVLRGFPLGARADVYLAPGGQIAGAVTDASGTARDVSVQCVDNNGQLVFILTYNASSSETRSREGITLDKHALVSADSATISATGLEPGAVATVTVSYREADWLGGEESDLRLLRLNEETNEYEAAGTNDQGVSASTGVPGDYGVDTTAKMVWAEVSQLGTFAVGTLGQDTPTEEEEEDTETEEEVLADEPGETPTEPPLSCGAGLMPIASMGGLIWLVLVSSFAAMKRRHRVLVQQRHS